MQQHESCSNRTCPWNGNGCVMMLSKWDRSRSADMNCFPSTITVTFSRRQYRSLRPPAAVDNVHRRFSLSGAMNSDTFQRPSCFPFPSCAALPATVCLDQNHVDWSLETECKPGEDGPNEGLKDGGRRGQLCEERETLADLRALHSPSDRPTVQIPDIRGPTHRPRPRVPRCIGWVLLRPTETEQKWQCNRNGHALLNHGASAARARAHSLAAG